MENNSTGNGGYTRIMTSKEKVKEVFPSAYAFRFCDEGVEIWIDCSIKWIAKFFGLLPGDLFPLASGKNWQEAWANAWTEVQLRMVRKLES
jgi:hypothetical protein